MIDLIHSRAYRLIPRLLIIALGLATSLWVATTTAQTLVLVSIDGFRWDYLDWPEATNMRSIAAQGSRVTKLRTVYPSKTFPGHLSIATGLHPTEHGVIDNYFCRSDRTDCYSMGKGRKDPSWLAGIPLWTLVEQQGGRASTFFWPESDAPFANTLPTDYRAFDGRIPHRERVQQVVDWLSLPSKQRPELVTLYFSVVDSASHTFGPTAPETLSAISEVDHQIAVLWQAIESGDLAEYWTADIQRALAPTFRVDEDGRAFTRLGMDRHMAVLDGLFAYDPLPDIASTTRPTWVVVCEPGVLDPSKAPASTELAASTNTSDSASSTDPAESLAQAWIAARRSAIDRLGSRFYRQRWSGAHHDVPLQWPALVAGLVETVLEHPDAGGEAE